MGNEAAAPGKPVMSFDELIVGAKFVVRGCPWCPEQNHQVQVTEFEQHAHCEAGCRFAKWRLLDGSDCRMNGIAACNMPRQVKTPRLFFSPVTARDSRGSAKS